MLLGANPKPRDLTHCAKSKPLENEVRGYLSNPLDCFSTLTALELVPTRALSSVKASRWYPKLRTHARKNTIPHSKKETEPRNTPRVNEDVSKNFPQRPNVQENRECHFAGCKIRRGDYSDSPNQSALHANELTDLRGNPRKIE